MHILKFRFLLLAIVLGLSACDVMWNETDEVVAAKAYRHPGPASVSLVTMVNTEASTGGHSALLISGSERVILDPAGTFFHDEIVEQNDVLFGMTPRLLEIYYLYHARDTHHVRVQTKEIPLAEADYLVRLARARGSTFNMFCTNTVSSVVSAGPSFKSLRPTMRPMNLYKAFAALPGVVETRVFDDDTGQNLDNLRERR